MIRILQQDNWLIKAVFAVIIIFAIGAMTITLVPGIFDNGDTTDASVYATVRTPGILGRLTSDSTPIKVTDVQRQAEQELQQQRLPDSPIYEQLMMGRAGQQLVAQAVLKHEADKLGLEVSDDALRTFLQTGPFAQVLFPNGKFIGEDRYIDFVEEEYRIPVTQFQDELKQELELQRLQALVTGGVSVSDGAVRAEYLQSGTKVKFEYAVVNGADIQQTINPSDADLQAFFQQSAARYATAMPETRSIEFFSVDSSNLPGGRQAVSDADVQAYYAAHQSDYKSQEQVKTRHILISVAKDADAKTDAAAKAKAEDVLRQVKSGGNFADLAKKFSDDPGSKDQGGELPLIPTSSLDPAYAQAAMALNPGQTSDVVRSQFGYHIIQTEQKQPAQVKSLADVRDSIVQTLQASKSAAAEQSFSSQLADEAKKNGLQKTAAAHGLSVIKTDYLGKTGVIPSLPDSTSLLSAAFAADKGAPQVASTGEGYAIFQVDDIKAAHAPAFADYKSHLLDDYRQQKTPELLNAKLSKLSDRAKQLGDLGKAAAELNVPLQTSDLVGRDAQVPQIGALSGAASVVFTLPKGGISGPVNEGANGAVLQVLDKQEPSPADIAANFAATKSKLLDQQRQEAFGVFASSLIDSYEKAGAVVYSRKPAESPLGN
jgi:peptidyl-prolyl cis-trans isomerase D